MLSISEGDWVELTNYATDGKRLVTEGGVRLTGRVLSVSSQGTYTAKDGRVRPNPNMDWFEVRDVLGHTAHYRRDMICGIVVRSVIDTIAELA